MKLFKAKVWSIADIGCLKWSCIFFGMIAGAFLPGFVRQYVWVFAIVATLLAIKPVFSCFSDEKSNLEKE